MTGRIVLVEFSPSGGLFQYATQLGIALAGRGERVELWTGPKPELKSTQPGFTIRSVLPTWHPSDTRVHSRAFRLLRRIVRAGQLLTAWFVLGGRLIRARPGAVLFSQWRFTIEPLFVVAIATLLPKTVFGIVAHEPLPRSDAKDTSTPKSGRLLEASFAAAWRRLDVAFVLGPVTKQVVLEHWRPRCDVHVIPMGDGGALRTGSEIRPVVDTDPVALFFGTWSKYKGIDVLLDAFSLVRNELPTAQLLLVGAPGGDVDLHSLLARAETIGNVEAAPRYCPMSEVSAIVESARLIVTPYVRASQSAVAHLAYTFGRPVVATNVGDLPAAVDDGITGFLVAPNDPEQLAAAMLKLLLNPDLAARLGEQGQRKVGEAWAAAAKRVGETVNEASRRLSQEL